MAPKESPNNLHSFRLVSGDTSGEGGVRVQLPSNDADYDADYDAVGSGILIERNTPILLLARHSQLDMLADARDPALQGSND